MRISLFLFVGVLSSVVSMGRADPNPKPDVSHLGSAGLSLPGSTYISNVPKIGNLYQSPGKNCPQHTGDCIEKINNLEYRNFINYDEQYYSVVSPRFQNSTHFSSNFQLWQLSFCIQISRNCNQFWRIQTDFSKFGNSLFTLYEICKLFKAS